VCTVLPLILRIWLKTAHLREEIVERLQTEFAVDIDQGLTPADAFTSIFAVFAQATSLVISSRRPDIAKLEAAIIKGRQMFQTLARIAGDANRLRENRRKRVQHQETADAQATGRKSQQKCQPPAPRQQTATAHLVSGIDDGMDISKKLKSLNILLFFQVRHKF